jgi:hypothetical protein
MGRYCRNCGYDLSATPIDDIGLGVSPECGCCFEDGNPYSYASEPHSGVSVWSIIVFVAVVVAMCAIASLS